MEGQNWTGNKKKFRRNIIIEELQKGSSVKNAKADNIKKKFGLKNQDDMAKTKSV